MSIFRITLLTLSLLTLMGCSSTIEKENSLANEPNRSTLVQGLNSDRWEWINQQIIQKNFSQIIQPLLELSRSNKDGRAEYFLASIYLYGQGVEKDTNLAIEWLTKSAIKDFADAQYQLASLYIKSEVVKPNHTAAFAWCSEAVKNKQPNAYGLLGYLYEYGLGVVSDLQKAFEFYSQGADLKDPAAMYHLANIYFFGKLGEVNYPEAFKHYSSASELEHIHAQDMLGLIYEWGHGVPINYQSAVKWYKLAANRGHARSQNALAVLYAHGKGIEKNQTEAIYWYRRSAQQGHAEAQFNLGTRYERGFGVLQDDILAKKWYQKSAAQGHVKARYNLGLFNLWGKGGEIDYSQALSLFRQVSEADQMPVSAAAEAIIGDIYLNGKGVERNQKRAIYWLERAAMRGDQTAKATLNELNQKAKHILIEFDQGVEAFHDGNLIEAEKIFRSVISQKDDLAKAYNMLGVVLGTQKKYQESLEFLRKAVLLDPLNAGTHANLGFSYAELHDWQAAIRHYREALKIEPNHPQARYNLSNALGHIEKDQN